jgi:very-short-patch-repair endonuclease
MNYIKQGQNNFGWRSLIERRKKLRKSMTPTEKKLWHRIRAKRIKGLQFRRQHGIRNFIADFCHAKSKTVIEIDGSIHSIKEIADYDAWRTSVLEDLGYTVIRFSNDQIKRDIDNVIEKILSHINSKAKSLSCKERFVSE